MTFRYLFSVGIVTLFLGACANTTITDNANSGRNSANAFRIPDNDYRNVDCSQLAHLISSVERLRQQGMPLNKAYDTVTPKDASARVQILHMIAIQGFYHALGGRKIDPDNLKQLETICTNTGITQSLVMSSNMVCHGLAEGTPLVRFLQSKRVPLQGTVKRANTLVKNLPLPVPDNYKLLKNSLPSLVENYVSTIYDQPEKSPSQLSDEFIQQCVIEESPPLFL